MSVSSLQPFPPPRRTQRGAPSRLISRNYLARLAEVTRCDLDKVPSRSILNKVPKRVSARSRALIHARFGDWLETQLPTEVKTEEVKGLFEKAGGAWPKRLDGLTAALRRGFWEAPILKDCPYFGNGTSKRSIRFKTVRPCYMKLDKRRVNLGRFYFYVSTDWDRNSLWFDGAEGTKRGRETGMLHPHIHGYGGPCWGHGASEVYTAMQQNNLERLLAITEALLEDPPNIGLHRQVLGEQLNPAHHIPYVSPIKED